MDESKLISENDNQELWERAGRMYAAMAYIENEKFPDVKIIYIMLGGDPDVTLAKEKS